jgi:hypothetical protein
VVYQVWQRIGKFAQQRPKIKVIKKKILLYVGKGFSSVDKWGSGLLIDVISLIFISQRFQSGLLLEIIWL